MHYLLQPIRILIDGRLSPVAFILRLMNAALCLVSFRLKLLRLPNKPIHAIFEMTNACNLRCPLCNTGGLQQHFRHIDKGLMRFAVFKAGIDKLSPQIQTVLLYTWGEPLLNKELYRCIEYAYHQGVDTVISSNMMLYDEKLGEKLIHSGLTKMIVSCDGLTQESYERYRRGGDLNTVTENVENLLALRRRHSSVYPKVEMQFIVFQHNEHEMADYRRFWEMKGVDAVNFIRMSYMSQIGKAIAETEGYIPLNPDFQPYHPYGSMKQCSDLYFHVTIDWNGDWYTCCFPPGEDAFRLGNIATDDFWRIWNGERYRYFRRLLRDQRVGDTWYETMCHDCTGVYPNKNAKSYWMREQKSDAADAVKQHDIG